MNFFFQDNLRVRPRFPEYEKRSGFLSFFAYLFSIIFWILLLFVFLVIFYTQWFLANISYLLQQVHYKNYAIPLWFGFIFVFFFFPVTLVIILLGTFVKILKN